MKNRLRRGFPRIRLVSSAALLLCGLATGCGGPTAKVELPPQGRQVTAMDDIIKGIKADPLAFLRTSLAETQKVYRFATLFQRQERLGLLAELKPIENIRAEYRDRPFSVRFTWLDEGSEYLQCVYVEGQNDNKVLLLQRRGLFGVPPKAQPWDPKLSVVFAKSRNPITDFGPRRMMERTIDRIEQARKVGPVSIRLLGVTEIGPAREPCFALELHYPKDDQFPCKLQDLYIHTQTRLPVGTYLWLTAKTERTERTLDGMYLYVDLNPEASIGDGTFVIDAAPASSTPGNAQRQAKTTSPAAEDGAPLPASTQQGEQQDHE